MIMFSSFRSSIHIRLIKKKSSFLHTTFISELITDILSFNKFEITDGWSTLIEIKTTIKFLNTQTVFSTTF